jgi:hypothetical protein
MIYRYHSPVENVFLTSGIFFFTLTFFSPLFWFPVIVIVLLLFLSQTARLRLERVRPHALALTVTLCGVIISQFAWGAGSHFYNISQLAFLFFAMVFGYGASRVNGGGGVPWIPFALLSTYFLLCLYRGIPPDQALFRNSENFISVIVLALYSSALILTKPQRPRLYHFLFAIVAIILSVYGVGRAGILASFVLFLLLIFSSARRLKGNFIRLAIIILTILSFIALLYSILNGLLVLEIFSRLSSRGLHDAARLTIWSHYFGSVSGLEWLFGSNYYGNLKLSKWDFNLHNSYISSWAHLGLIYLFIIGFSLFLTLRSNAANWYMPVALFPLGLRAFTDIQILAGKYDFIFIAALFILLERQSRVGRRVPQTHTPILPSGLGSFSGAPCIRNASTPTAAKVLPRA